MDNKIRRLREKGVVLTIQRMAVLEMLNNSSTHPTVEAIHRELVKKHPTLSLATVYNTLQMLRQAGEIQELNIGKEKRFDPSIDLYHHFYCRGCERIIDLEISCPIAQKGRINGHKIETVQAIFFGICADCLKKGKDNA